MALKSEQAQHSRLAICYFLCLSPDSVYYYLNIHNLFVPKPLRALVIISSISSSIHSRWINFIHLVMLQSPRNRAQELERTPHFHGVGSENLDWRPAFTETIVPGCIVYWRRYGVLHDEHTAHSRIFLCLLVQRLKRLYCPTPLAFMAS